MDDIILNIMVELLSILAMATKELKHGRSSESVSLTCCLYSRHAVKFEKKREKNVEAVLQRLDRLTLDEARITTAQTLEIVHGLVRNMRVVMEGEKARSFCESVIHIE
jgi:hypothetical protein